MGINYALVGKIELAQRKFTIPALSFAASIAGSFIVIYAAKLVYRDIKVYNPLCFIGRNSMTVLVFAFYREQHDPMECDTSGKSGIKKENNHILYTEGQSLYSYRLPYGQK